MSENKQALSDWAYQLVIVLACIVMAGFIGVVSFVIVTLVTSIVGG